MRSGILFLVILGAAAAPAAQEGLPTPAELWARLQPRLPPLAWRVVGERVVPSATDPGKKLRRLEVEFCSQVVAGRPWGHPSVVFLPADPAVNARPPRRGRVVVVGQRSWDGLATGPWRENSALIPFTGTPAGGGYSNARDLLRFRLAFTAGELLDERYTAWVVTDRLPDAAPDPRGIGLGVAGGAPGVNAELEIGGEMTVIVLANLDPPSASDVARHLLDLLEAVE